MTCCAGETLTRYSKEQQPPRALPRRWGGRVPNETGDEELREASMESLMRLINQFKDEITRYEAHQPARRGLRGPTQWA